MEINPKLLSIKIFLIIIIPLFFAGCIANTLFVRQKKVRPEKKAASAKSNSKLTSSKSATEAVSLSKKAKELIANSRYGGVSGLPPITITTSGWGGMIGRDLEAIIMEWRNNLGVEVTVRQLEPERFLYHLKEEKDDMYIMGWIADYPHPQDFLDILFRTGTENNFADYSNPDVDVLLDEAAVETDTAQSMELYRQAEQMMVDDAACLPLWFGQNYILIKPYVEGYELNPMGFAMLNKVRILGE